MGIKGGAGSESGSSGQLPGLLQSMLDKFAHLSNGLNTQLGNVVTSIFGRKDLITNAKLLDSYESMLSKRWRLKGKIRELKEKLERSEDEVLAVELEDTEEFLVLVDSQLARARKALRDEQE